MNNHEVYSIKDELNNWTERKGLTSEEAYLINKYINNKGKLIEAGTGGAYLNRNS